MSMFNFNLPNLLLPYAFARLGFAFAFFLRPLAPRLDFRVLRFAAWRTLRLARGRSSQLSSESSGSE